MVTKKEYLKGGKGDYKNSSDIAKKYNLSLEEVRPYLIEGISHELEHTDNVNIAREIAIDHLYGEDIMYYKKLATIEKN